MKTHFTQIALIAALSAAGATTAFAHTDYSEGGYSEAGVTSSSPRGLRRSVIPRTERP